MAARENQGLQIALIIFVMLTIVLSVTTYIFFDNYNKERLDKQAAIEKAKNFEKTVSEVNMEREGYLNLINEQNFEEKGDVIVKKKIAELQRYIALSGINTQLRNYPQVLQMMAEAVQEKEKKLLAHKEAEDKAKAELAALQAKTADQVAKANAETTKTQGEYTSFSGTIKTALAALAQSKTEAEKQINDKIAENQALSDKVAAITKSKTVVEKNLTGVIKNQKEVLDTYKDPRPTLTDGQIVYVDERTKSAYVNIGRADSLQRRVSFSVYDRGTNDVATAVKKGAIEIIEIIDDKLARARIIENSVSDPILPGDFIDSTLWYPGKRMKIAIAGAIDYNNDGVSDRANLKDLIIANGGAVVADVTERAEVTGAITPDTERVIVGRGPDDRTDPKFQKAWNDLMADAKKYNVQLMPLAQFLDSVGYTPNTNNSQDAGNQRLVDTTPRPKDNQGQIAPGAFRTRTPPEGTGNSAFQK
jgi:hypothetical protein